MEQKQKMGKNRSEWSRDEIQHRQIQVTNAYKSHEQAIASPFIFIVHCKENFWNYGLGDKKKHSHLNRAKWEQLQDAMPAAMELSSVAMNRKKSGQALVSRRANLGIYYEGTWVPDSMDITT